MPTESKGVEGQAEHRAAETPARKSRRPAPDGGQVGEALRSVYDDMLNEGIPDDLLELLGKLD